jgi:UDP-2,4-diacetamido-2,4,6-trideoxy-beta-L-altropyranose hydrolase
MACGNPLMVNAPQVAFRVDSSKRMGSGHLTRCLTLAEELRRRGMVVRFICREHPGHLIARVEDAGYPVARLEAPPSSTVQAEDYAVWLGVPQEQDACETLARLHGARQDWLVVDHYGLDARWERALRIAAARIFVIDDLANRQHDCDLLLDQNYLGAATSSRYDSLIPNVARRLLGPQFALLQPEYRQLRSMLPARDGVVKRLLVFFGGSDLARSTFKVLQALDCGPLASIAVDVVIGEGMEAQERAAIEQWVQHRPGAALHRGLPTLAGLMLRADLAVGAGGSTTWERACLSLPSLVATIAHNQEEVSAVLARDGCHILLGDSALLSVDDWRTALIDATANQLRLADIARRAGALVDGSGCERVATAVIEPPPSTLGMEDVEGYWSLEEPVLPGSALRINVLSDPDSWMNSYITDLVADWIRRGHRLRWSTNPQGIRQGDVCFILGCSQILRDAELSLNAHNLVVHGSALPEGRGWSPMTWQVLADRRSITITLFEAADKVDAGRIHLQATLSLDGGELIDEWRALLARATTDLCEWWIDEFPAIIAGAREQVGEPTFYARRGPADSRLDPYSTIASQFDLLRTVDNARYPAFFDYRGKRYRLLIERSDVTTVDT